MTVWKPAECTHQWHAQVNGATLAVRGLAECQVTVQDWSGEVCHDTRARSRTSEPSLARSIHSLWSTRSSSHRTIHLHVLVYVHCVHTCAIVCVVRP